MAHGPSRVSLAVITRRRRMATKPCLKPRGGLHGATGSRACQPRQALGAVASSLEA